MCQNASKNIVSIATVALDSLTAVLKITNPGDPNLAKYEADAAALLIQLQAWKSGTAAQDVVEAINLVIDDVNLLPVPSEYQAVIAVALAGLSSIIALVNQNSTTGGATQVASAVAMARIGVSEPQYHGRYAAVYYTRDWNSAVGKFSELKAAKIPSRELLTELLP